MRYHSASWTLQTALALNRSVIHASNSSRVRPAGNSPVGSANPAATMRFFHRSYPQAQSLPVCAYMPRSKLPPDYRPRPVFHGMIATMWLWEGQIADLARRGEVLRGESSPFRRPGIRRPQRRDLRSGESRATRGLRNGRAQLLARV